MINHLKHHPLFFVVKFNSTLTLTSQKTRPQTRPSYLQRLLLTFVLLICTSWSHGALIFSDDFSRDNSNDVQNNWQELEKDSNDVAIYQQQLRLRDNQSETPSAAALQAISLESYQDLRLTFDWRATTSTEASDTLFVGWQRQDESFTNLWSSALGGSGFNTVSFDITTADIPADYASLAIWIAVGSANETVYIDNLLLSGELINSGSTEDGGPTENSSQVPEPSSLALLTLGLALVTRKKKSIQ